MTRRRRRGPAPSDPGTDALSRVLTMAVTRLEDDHEGERSDPAAVRSLSRATPSGTAACPVEQRGGIPDLLSARVAADAPTEPTAAEALVMDSVGADGDQRQRRTRRRSESEIDRPGRLDHAPMTLRSHPGSYAARAVRRTFLLARPSTREEHLMFSPHDTSSIHRNAHERIDRLHREARVASSLPSLHTSYRMRIASVVRRIASWIEPRRPAVRVTALHRPQFESD